MRIGLSVSGFAHAAILLWGVVSLPSASPFEIEDQEPLPVDILTVQEFTELTAGTRDGDAKAPPAPPEPVEEAKASDTPEDAKPSAQQSTAPEPAAKPEPAPEPLRTAALAPETEPAPEPAPQAEPAPQPTNVPLPAVKPRVASRPSPAPQPPAPAPAASRPEATFDADKIAALLNKVPESGGGPQTDIGEFTASLGVATGTKPRMTISEIDYLRQQIARCWNPPIGVVDAGDLLVRIGLRLNSDGTLSAPPQLLNTSPDPVFAVAADAAVRAINRCQPYSLPPEKYDLWREIHVNFDPKEILGG